MRIGIVAPSCQLDASIPDRLTALAAQAFGTAAPELVFHPQCFLSQGHFAGPDEARITAFVDYANDPSLDAIWFARGGYGACRVADAALSQLGSAADDKIYMGYSDAGYLLAGLMHRGIGRVVHGPMPADLNRDGGDAAVVRAVRWMLDPLPFAADGQKYSAFNLTVLCQLLGTPLQPDLTGHVLMVEEVAEYMYRIDRCFYQLTANPGMAKITGLMLGRCSAIPDNNPDFLLDEETICRQWCGQAGIPYLGRADIGHDAQNQIVPFS
jgi:muramoyltetrapeptide carboxypeptidase